MITMNAIKWPKNEPEESSELPFLFHWRTIFGGERAGLNESDIAAVYDYLERREKINMDRE